MFGKNLCFLLLFCQSLAFFSIDDIDTGCKSMLERASVVINGQEIECGKEYPLESVKSKDQPQFSFPAKTRDDLYIVTMFDPDAPSPSDPKYRSWLHFMAVNVMGQDLGAGISIPSDNIVMEYAPPSPPQDSGYHRYVTLILKQPAPLKGIFEHRPKFNIDHFRNKYNLTAKAFNMFRTQAQ